VPDKDERRKQRRKGLVPSTENTKKQVKGSNLILQRFANKCLI
jgi:hypothetical protein